MNASDIRFRASGVGHIMGDGKSITEKQIETIKDLQTKDKISGLTDKQREELDRLIRKRDYPELSETAKTHCVNVYVSEVYGRREMHDNKFLQKGNEREEDSMTLLSVMTKKYLTKNTERRFNDYVTGEWDTHIGTTERPIIEIFDTKSSWSAHTFFRAKHSELNKLYYWQIQSYCDITGADRGFVAFCLVNGTARHIMAEKRRLAFSMGLYDEQSCQSNPEYYSRCLQIERNHIFDMPAFIKEYPDFQFDHVIDEWKYDIPKEDRCFLFRVDRDDVEIKKMHRRIETCWEWMDKNLFKSNIL